MKNIQRMLIVASVFTFAIIGLAACGKVSAETPPETDSYAISWNTDAAIRSFTVTNDGVALKNGSKVDEDTLIKVEWVEYANQPVTVKAGTITLHNGNLFKVTANAVIHITASANDDLIIRYQTDWVSNGDPNYMGGNAFMAVTGGINYSLFKDREDFLSKVESMKYTVTDSSGKQYVSATSSGMGLKTTWDANAKYWNRDVEPEYMPFQVNFCESSTAGAYLTYEGWVRTYSQENFNDTVLPKWTGIVTFTITMKDGSQYMIMGDGVQTTKYAVSWNKDAAELISFTVTTDGGKSISSGSKVAESTKVIVAWQEPENGNVIVNVNGVKMLNGKNLTINSDIVIDIYTTVIDSDAAFLDAMANQADGQVWFVKNGTYNVQVYLNTNITIIGESQAGVVIKGTNEYKDMKIITSDRVDMNGSVMLTENSSGIIVIEGATVELDMLTVLGTTPELVNNSIDSNTRFNGILFINSNLTMNNVTVTSIIPTTEKFGMQTNASANVYGTGSELRYKFVMSNCEINNFQKTGVLLRAAVSTVEITNSHIKGIGATELTAQNGITLEAASATFTNNIFEDLQYTGNDDSCGILPNMAEEVYESVVHYTYSGNTFNDVDIPCSNLDGEVSL